MKFGLLKVFVLGSVVPLAVALNACGDDSSTSGPSDGGNRGGIPDTVQTMNELLSDIPCGKSQKCVVTYLVEYHGKAVCDGEDGWVFGSLIEKMDCDFTESSDDGDSSSSNGKHNSSSSSVPPSDVERSSSSVASSSSAVSSSSEESSSSVEPPSSSSSMESSSSITSSSSVTSISYGEIVDSRDNQVYKTVTIGTQTWMAENLNYAYTSVKYNYNGYTSDSTSWCYENKASNCDKYGRLYTWSAVMDSAAQFSVNAGTNCGERKTCTPNSPHRGICPEGWHVPTNEEYSALYTYIGGSNIAGSTLKSTSGWYGGGNGIDKYGFSALPAGYRSYYGDFDSEGYYAELWTASENTSGYAWRQYIYCLYNYARQEKDSYKSNGRSLRCLKD